MNRLRSVERLRVGAPPARRAGGETTGAVWRTGLVPFASRVTIEVTDQWYGGVSVAI
jgi:hypothetical protein